MNVFGYAFVYQVDIYPVFLGLVYGVVRSSGSGCHMMLVERPGYRIDGRTIKRALDRISWSYCRREHKPLHHCIHLYWLLFGSYHGVVLVLVVLVMTRPSSPKTVFVCVFYCVFGVWDFAGSSMWKVSLFQLFEKYPLLVLIFCRVGSYRPLSNKIGFTSFGLYLQNIWCFRFTKERSIISQFGWILPYCTMMFLCIIL